MKKEELEDFLFNRLWILSVPELEKRDAEKLLEDLEKLGVLKLEG